MDKIEQIVKNIDRYDCIIALASVVAAQQLYSEFKSASERFFSQNSFLIFIDGIQ